MFKETAERNSQIKCLLQISDRVRALGQQAQRELAEQFDRIDEIAAFNTEKVLAAFQKHKVAESFFQGTTGYGYDDFGPRKRSGEIYADILLARKMPWCASIL